MTMTTEKDLTLIISVDGDDYEEAVEAAEDNGGSTEAVVAHLAQWDYGSENDEASEIMGSSTLDELEALPHQLHQVCHDELTYYLLIDHGLRFYALYRPGLHDQP